MAVFSGRNYSRLDKLSILYSHIVRRPLSRALPRIPRRSSTWPCDNLYVGRGANTPPLCFVSTAEATGSPSSSHERPYLSPTPHIRHPPPLPFQLRSATETASSLPISETLWAEKVALVEIDKTDKTKVEQVELRTAVAEKVETQNSKENAENHDVAETSPSQPVAEVTERSIEGDIRVGSENSAEMADPRTTISGIPLSNRVHIVGFHIQTRFVAHALASKPDIPVNFLVHNPIVMSRWGEEARGLILLNGQGHYVSSVGIPCPEPVIDPRYRYSKTSKKAEADFLDNVIINTTTGAILPTLHDLRDRIDRHTTICLLHPGLGLVERINEVLFPDPLERPNFILGHFTHKLSKMPEYLYSVKLHERGHLYLCGTPNVDDTARAKSPAAQEALQRSRHLIDLLTSAENLGAVGLNEVRFLLRKLPWVIFSSVADSICVVLGCRYDQIHPNAHAWAMWEDLLDESVAIVSQLPELQVMPHVAKYFTGHSFRRKMRRYLVAQKKNHSPWVKQVRRGIDTPVNYFNGYLVRRAEELGLDHKRNSMAMEAVKARQNSRRWEIRLDMLGLSQYMGDTDAIAAGQPVPSLDDFDPDVDLD
ncbi:hypothetical protein GGR55DRAFT_691469 [Xylaria sp. FL0064]|nr:hypothetical protein GGR55DRAFT_691469 [Xylaria sp. FL0064]